MRWVAAAIGIYAVIEWFHMYAPYYEWNLPIWLGHIAFGAMLALAVIGAVRSSK